MDRDVLIPNRSDPPAFRHLVWTFLTAAFIGERLEVLYVWSATGVVMSRSSLLYGPFSLVWGLGAALVTLCLWPFRRRGPRMLLLVGVAIVALTAPCFHPVAAALALLFPRLVIFLRGFVKPKNKEA